VDVGRERGKRRGGAAAVGTVGGRQGCDDDADGGGRGKESILGQDRAIWAVMSEVLVAQEFSWAVMG
jgi:hypothetical protein